MEVSKTLFKLNLSLDNINSLRYDYEIASLSTKGTKKREREKERDIEREREYKLLERTYLWLET